MAGDLDPATMDALNELGAEIEAQAGAEAAVAAADATARREAPAVEDAAHEAPEGQEAAVEGEDEEGEVEKPVKATGAEKRIKELTAEKYAARARAEEEKAKREALERRIAELEAARQPADPAAPSPVKLPTETAPDFEARVQAEAARRAKEASFNEACNRVAEKGKETHKDFGEAQGALMGAFGRQVNMRPEFLQAITRLENGHDVFHYLGTNLEAAEAIFGHAEPVDLVMAMGELSTKLKTPKAPKVSGAPAPVTPIRGGASNRSAVRLDDEKISNDDFKAHLFKEMAS